MRYLLLLFFAVSFYSCWWGKKDALRGIDPEIKVLGWKPVYAPESVYSKLTVYNTSQSVTKAGKIYVYGNLIFQNDMGKGIHVIDNNTPSAAHRIAFWALPGNTEMSIKGNYLYANNYRDLVVIDLNDIANPQIVKRQKDVFITYNQSNPYPWQVPPETGYYQCPQFYPDSVVVDWVRDSVSQYCYRP